MGHPPALAQLSPAPVFNTKAVAIETGVPADTFRAWERRYGVPRPQRTVGGHRLYSERDIALIRWLRDRTEEGMNISQAVLLLQAVPVETATAPMVDTAARAFDHLVEKLVLALTSFDASLAESLVSEAFALHPFEDVLLHVLEPTMIAIGEGWQRGEISVAAEHFASQFVRQKLAGLLHVFGDRSVGKTIVLGCAPAELHELGALLIAVFLARRGWNVVYLGPIVPLADLLLTIPKLNPVLVALSASTVETATQIAEVGRALSAAFPRLRYGFGGRIFNANPELRNTVPGTFLGSDAREVAAAVDALVSRPAD